MPGVAFPPVGPVGHGSPPSSVLCSAKTATLPVSGRFARRSLPDTLPASVVFVVSPWGSWRGGSLPPPPGPFVTPSPHPGGVQGDMWLSHLPQSPLLIHSPLLDPRGVLDACPSALSAA